MGPYGTVLPATGAMASAPLLLQASPWWVLTAVSVAIVATAGRGLVRRQATRP